MIEAGLCRVESRDDVSPDTIEQLATLVMEESRCRSSADATIRAGVDGGLFKRVGVVCVKTG